MKRVLCILFYGADCFEGLDKATGDGYALRRNRGGDIGGAHVMHARLGAGAAISGPPPELANGLVSRTVE